MLYIFEKWIKIFLVFLNVMCSGGEAARNLLVDSIVRLARSPLEYMERQYEALAQQEHVGVTSQGDQLEQMFQGKVAMGE